MSVEHLVFFKFKDGTPLAAIESVHTGLRALKDKVPGVLDLTVGANFSPARSQGFTTALFVRLKDKEALDVYAKHPAHLEVVEHLVKPHAADIIALDYEA